MQCTIIFFKTYTLCRTVRFFITRGSLLNVYVHVGIHTPLSNNYILPYILHVQSNVQLSTDKKLGASKDTKEYKEI